MRRFAPLMVGLGLILTLGCYTDDVSGLVNNGKPLKPIVRVNITDDPFPFDSVGSVNIYVDSIEATAVFDTSGGTQAWVTLATPHQAVNLLDYQDGTLAFLGQSSASPGQYRSVRMTIDVDSSSIIATTGSKAVVNWGQTGPVTLYALVSPALAIGDSISDLVIDFDVGRSFLYNLFGNKEFEFEPWLRAVNRAQTGSIQGTVTTSYYGSPQPVPNADVAVYQGAQTRAVLATGRTDAAGRYLIPYLPADTYTLSVTQPLQPGLAIVTQGGLNVTVGGALTQDVSLPAAGNGGPGIHIAGPNTIYGPNTVGVGGVLVILAAATDSQGHAVPNPAITWSVSDTSLARTVGSGTVDSVFGKAAGNVFVRAVYGVYRDSLTVVVTSSAPYDSMATVAPLPGLSNLPRLARRFGLGANAGGEVTLKSRKGHPLTDVGLVRGH